MKKTTDKILNSVSYNAPVILTFTLIAVVVEILHSITPLKFTHNLFVASRGSLINPLFYVRLFTHAIGHANWSHLIANFTTILLIGPMLEEKYGSKKLLKMMIFTAFITGILHVILTPHGAVCGASGIVFMFILLAACSNIEDGTIPLTLILVAVIYIGGEVMDMFKRDNVSQLSHIVGGICGGCFGLIFTKPKKSTSYY